MLRKTTFAPKEVYHLYTRGVDKRLIFDDIKSKERFQLSLFLGNNTQKLNIEEVWEVYRNKNRIYKDFSITDPLVDIFAYCLMDNHVHLLVREKKVGGISNFARKIFTSHASYFNKKNERTGTLFESRFKSKHVDNDAYFRHLFSYIHLNPLKFIDPHWKEKPLDTQTVREYAEFLESYSYSSYKDHAGEMRPERKILTMDALPDYFNPTLDVKELFESMRKNEEHIIP